MTGRHISEEMTACTEGQDKASWSEGQKGPVVAGVSEDVDGGRGQSDSTALKNSEHST